MITTCLLRKQIHFFAHFVGEVGEEQAVVRRCSVKKVFLDLSVLRQPEACNFIIKETLAQVFSCEFCEISKNTFLYRTPLVAASGGDLQ